MAKNEEKSNVSSDAPVTTAQRPDGRRKACCGGCCARLFEFYPVSAARDNGVHNRSMQ